MTVNGEMAIQSSGDTTAVEQQYTWQHMGGTVAVRHPGLFRCNASHPFQLQRLNGNVPLAPKHHTSYTAHGAAGQSNTPTKAHASTACTDPRQPWSSTCFSWVKPDSEFPTDPPERVETHKVERLAPLPELNPRPAVGTHTSRRLLPCRWMRRRLSECLTSW